MVYECIGKPQVMMFHEMDYVVRPHPLEVCLHLMKGKLMFTELTRHQDRFLDGAEAETSAEVCNHFLMVFRMPCDIDKIVAKRRIFVSEDSEPAMRVVSRKNVHVAVVGHLSKPF